MTIPEAQKGTESSTETLKDIAASTKDMAILPEAQKTPRLQQSPLEGILGPTQRLLRLTRRGEQHTALLFPLFVMTCFLLRLSFRCILWRLLALFDRFEPAIIIARDITLGPTRSGLGFLFDRDD